MFKFATRIWVLILAVSFVLSLGLNAAVVGIASVGTVVAGIYDAVTGTTSAYTDTKERALRSERKIAELDLEKTRLQSEVGGLLEQRDRAVRRAGELFDQVEAGKADNARLTDKIIENEARISGLEDDIRAKDRKISVLTEDVKKPRKVVYRGTQKTVSEAILDTNKRIARRTVSAATRNASSVVAESIPYFGIAVMLAVTAADLNDSCNTIKDLHALDVAIDPNKAFSPDDSEICGLKVPTPEETWEQVKNGSAEAWDQAREYLPSLPEYSLPAWNDVSLWP